MADNKQAAADDNRPPDIQIDFNELNKKCEDVMNLHEELEQNGNEIWSSPWTDKQIDLFASQFINYATVDDTIDYEKVDFSSPDVEYFKKRFPKLQPEIYEMLEDYGNRKIQDNREAPLQIKNGEFRPFAEQ
jgi:hypothetical protein